MATISTLKPSLLPHPATARPQALSKLHCTSRLWSIWSILYHRFGLFNPNYLDCRESKSTSISIHRYVVLHRSLILYGKHFSIDLSSIDSNGIRSPCATWMQLSLGVGMMMDSGYGGGCL